MASTRVLQASDSDPMWCCRGEEDLANRPLLLVRKKRPRRSIARPPFRPSSSSSSGRSFSSSIRSSCVRLSTLSARRPPKNLVTLLVGEERKAFRVEPQILEHYVVQCLVEKTGSPALVSGRESHDDLQQGMCDRRVRRDHRVSRIHLNCDAILFEHILWLLSNDDPSLRYLNVDELMEFYS